MDAELKAYIDKRFEDLNGQLSDLRNYRDPRNNGWRLGELERKLEELRIQVIEIDKRVILPDAPAPMSPNPRGRPKKQESDQ